MTSTSIVARGAGMPPALPGRSDSLPAEEDYVPRLASTMLAGLVAIGVFLGGFLAWGFLADLNSAAIAPGVVIADSKRKTVQHLEGGILRQLLVKEGDNVKAGQVLLRLDNTAADAAVAQLEVQRVNSLARIARLEAERADRRTIQLPDELAVRRQEPAVAEALKGQENVFRTRWRAYDGAVAVLRKRIEQHKSEMSSAQAQLKGTESRLGLVREELAAVQQLFSRGFERRPRLLELQRMEAELAGRVGELEGAISKSEQAVAATELEIAQVGDTRSADVARELQEVQVALADVNERLRATLDVLKRKDVLAPQDGVVVDVKMFTPGGVIAPGQPILDIVPYEDDLIIEARVNPIDIEAVRVNLPAQVRLTAYKQRRVPLLEGRVDYVSADKLVDQRDGLPYFVARVRLPRSQLEAVPGVELSSGMPAEVYVVTGERRAIDYFVSPITESFRRAFRED